MGKVRLSNKLARELLKYAEEHGFEWNGKLTGGGHIMLRHPNGGRVVLPATPGPRNTGDNSRKDIERVARDGHSI